jgi:hypothetical protein
MRKTTIWMMALLLCWGCGPGEEEELGADRLGRFEYWGLYEANNFRYYYPSGSDYKQLTYVVKGVGRIESELCKFVPGVFYGCDKPKLLHISLLGTRFSLVNNLMCSN